jgi:hypothetical protein
VPHADMPGRELARSCITPSIVISYDSVIAIVSTESLEEIASHVSEVLGVSLHPRESSYYGDPYYSAWPESELKLTLNRDPQYLPGDPPEERFFLAEAQDAQFVLWEADPEDERVELLRAGGLNARVVTSA